MPFTLAEDCSNITFTPQVGLVDVAATQVETKINCCSDGTVITDVSGLLNNNTVVLTPSDLGQDGSIFLDGVYYIKVEAQINNTLYTDQVCFFVSCNINCLVIDRVAGTNNTLATVLHQGVELGELCNDCECTEMCLNYEKLLKELNLDTTLPELACCDD